MRFQTLVYRIQSTPAQFPLVHVLSSVGIATGYGLDGPGSNPGGVRLSAPVQPDTGPTQPCIQWVPGVFPEGIAAWA
jgi:hypothetical protein